MGMPLVALQGVQPQIDVQGAQAKQLQLRDLANKNSMFPVAQQAAQTQLESQKVDLEEKRQHLKDEQIWSDSMKEAAKAGPQESKQGAGSILQNAADIATRNGASFNSIMAHNEALANLQKTLSTTRKEDIETLQKQHENASSMLHNVLSKPDEELEAEYNKQLAMLRANPSVAQASYGLNPEDLPAFKDRTSLEQEADMLQGYSNVVNEHAKMTEAEARRTQAGVSAAKETREAGNPQPGTVTPAIEYEQKMANYRAELGKHVGLQNELQKNGISQLDKMFTDPVHGYTAFLSQAQGTKSAVASAQSGNELATSLIPLMTALGVTSFGGVHRVNQQEINAAGPTVGSYFRRLNTLLDRAGTGKIQPDTARETNELIDNLVNAKHHATLQGASMVARNAGLTPETTTVMDRSGNLANLGDIAWKGTDQYKYSGKGDRNDEKNWEKVQ